MVINAQGMKHGKIQIGQRRILVEDQILAGLNMSPTLTGEHYRKISRRVTVAIP
jgi:hypothetical protein